MTIDELLDRWEEDPSLTAGELCRDHPELLDELRAKIAALESIDPLLEGGTPPDEDLSDAGRYKPTGLHASGGLGDVYVARDEELGRDVALKRPRRRDLFDRFLREGELTGRLEHPGIVPVYGLGHDAKGHPFYAMRFVRGETLDDAIARRAPQLTLMRHYLALCQTVAYAHSRGVIHRDLKPSNVMIGQYGETILVDWGLAKPVGEDEEGRGEELDTLTDVEETQLGERKGSPAYMSPEQARGEPTDYKSDIYSLGVTLRKVLTGAPVGDFRGAPKPLVAVYHKATRQDAGDRYPNAADLAKDIENWLADQPVSAWREPFSLRLRRFLKRHKTLVAAGAAVLAVASVAGAYLAYVERENNIALKDAANRETARRIEAEESNARNAVTLAQLSLDAGRLDSARRALLTVPPRMQRFEWHVIEKRTQRELMEIDGPGWSWRLGADSIWLGTDRHDLSGLAWGQRTYLRTTPRAWPQVSRNGTVLERDPWRIAGKSYGAAGKAALSDDGKHVAIVDPAHGVRMFETASGRQLWAERLHAAKRGAFSGDGRTFAVSSQATGAKDRVLSIYSVRGGKRGEYVRPGQDYWPFALSHFGTHVAIGLGDSFEVVSGKETVMRGEGGTEALAFLDGTHIVAADRSAFVRVYDLEGRSMIKFAAHEGELTSLDAYDRRIATSSGREVRIWDPLGARTHVPRVWGPFVLVCGNRILCGASIVDARTRTVEREIVGVVAQGATNGTRVAVSDYRQKVDWLDLETGKREEVLRVQRHVVSLAVSRSGDLAALTWDRGSGEGQLHIRDRKWPIVKGRAVEFSHDGARLYCFAKEDSVVEMATMQKLPLPSNVQFSVFSRHGALHVGERVRYRGAELEVGKLGVRDAAISPDGERVALALHDSHGRGLVALYERTGRKLLEFVAHEKMGIMMSIAWDGAFLVTTNTIELGVWEGSAQR